MAPNNALHIGRIRPNALAVRDFLERLNDWLIAQHIAKDSAGSVQLILAETLNNLVEHAGLMDHQSINVAVCLEGEIADCRIRDCGKRDRSLLRRDFTCPLADADLHAVPEGGFGLGLIQSLAKEIRYLPTESGNHLQILVPLITKPVQIC